MAPEQASGRLHDIGPLTDVYALGAILYVCLTGRPPFQAASVMETLKQVLEADPVPPSQLNGNVPRDLETVCLKCLEKARGKRYGRASDLSEDLERFVRGEPVLARPVGRTERSWRWCKRNPTLASLLVVIVALLMTGTTISTALYLNLRDTVGKVREERDNVQTEKKNVQVELAKSQFVDYASRLREAAIHIERRQLLDAEFALSRCNPKLCDWEYHYLRRLAPGSSWSQEITDPMGAEINSLCFSPDGSRVASGGSFGITVWNAHTSQRLLNYEPKVARISTVGFSKDSGRIVVSGMVSSAPIKKTFRRGHWSEGQWRDQSGAAGRVSDWDFKTGQEHYSAETIEKGIASIIFSPDERLIASGNDNGTVTVWNARTRQALHSCKKHTAGVVALAISPEGKRIASGGHDKTVRVWDAQSGQEICSMRGHTGSILALAFSTDGTRIVSGSADETLKVWEASTGNEGITLRGHEGGVNSVAFASDGKRVVSGSDDCSLKIWYAQTGSEQCSFKANQQIRAIRCVAFSPDGKQVAWGAQTIHGQSEVKVWDVQTVHAAQQHLTLTGHTDSVSSVSFSPDGNQILSGSSDKTVRVWHTASGQSIHILDGRKVEEVTHVSYSPDGKRVFACSGAQVKVWDAHTGIADLPLLGHKSPVWCAVISPDGKLLATGGGTGANDSMEKWLNRLTLEGIMVEKAKELGAAFGPPQGEPRLQTTDGVFLPEIKLWDVSLRKALLSFEGKSPGSVKTPQISGRDRTLSVTLEPEEAGTLSLEGHQSSVNCLAFSPDSKSFVTGSADALVKVWDTRSGRKSLHLTGHTAGVNSVAFSHDGTLIVSGSGDTNVIVWDALTGRQIHSLRGHHESVTSVAISPNGKRVVSGSADRTLKVWDIETGQEALTLKGHTAVVHSVAFSPDGTRIVSASRDKTIKVWDATPRTPPQNDDARREPRS